MPALAWLWVKMGDRHGHAFTSQYGTDPAGKSAETWAEDLAGLSDEQIRFGFDECLKLGGDWPPSSSRFRMLCLNIPTLASVRQEFKTTDGKHRSPFARKLWQFIDSYAFGRSDQDKADRMFRDAYDLTREHVMSGGELDPAPVAELEHAKPSTPVPASEEFVKRNIEEILSTLMSPASRPTVKEINRTRDLAAGRTFLCVTLSDDRVIRPPAIETDMPSQAEIDRAIEAEIDRVMAHGE